VESITFRIAGDDHKLTVENTAIAMFRREEQDMDYFHITAGEESKVIFRQRELLLWMGGVAVRFGDEETIRRAERKFGSFYQKAGWNPRVYLEDHANEEERNWYANLLLKDLGDAPPEDWVA
jgi:hypothetical protein